MRRHVKKSALFEVINRSFGKLDQQLFFYGRSTQPVWSEKNLSFAGQLYFQVSRNTNRYQKESIQPQINIVWVTEQGNVRTA